MIPVYFFIDLTVIKVPGDKVSKGLRQVITRFRQPDLVNLSISLNKSIMNLHEIF